MKLPKDVEAAVGRGVDYILRTEQSYILYMRTAPDTPATPRTEMTTAKMLARSVLQPPLDIFHRQSLRAMREAATPDLVVNIPVIF